MGQSVALSPLDYDRAIMVYNQRKYGDIGVGLVVVRPDHYNFNVQLDEMVWRAYPGSKVKGLVNPDDWENFTFGEPSTVILPSGEILVVFWNNNNDSSSISGVKVKF